MLLSPGATVRGGVWEVKFGSDVNDDPRFTAAKSRGSDMPSGVDVQHFDVISNARAAKPGSTIGISPPSAEAKRLIVKWIQGVDRRVLVVQRVKSRCTKPVSRRIDDHNRFCIAGFVKAPSKVNARLHDKDIVVVWV